MWPLKPRPLVISFDHVVCKPGDVVVITLPESVESSRYAEVSRQALAWSEKEGVKLLVLCAPLKGSVQ